MLSVCPKNGSRMAFLAQPFFQIIVIRADSSDSWLKKRVQQTNSHSPATGNVEFHRNNRYSIILFHDANRFGSCFLPQEQSFPIRLKLSNNSSPLRHSSESIVQLAPKWNEDALKENR